MAKVRSPNYPVMDLSEAIEAMKGAFKKEGRNKMSRSVLAAHLGYSSLNGRSLGKIGAVRAYGLIEGSGDELRVAEDTVTLISAPATAPERREALERCAFRPTLFGELKSEFPDRPSVENLQYELVKRGFSQEAAGKAASTYLLNVALVAGTFVGDIVLGGDGKPAGDTPPPPPPSQNPPPPPPGQEVKMQTGERVLTTGLLAKDANFRLLVSGTIGVKEIEMLIRKLELDKEILAESDAASTGAEN